MTTDRTAAPTRGTALATAPANRAQTAPPADVFSALLGAVTPKTDGPARREDTPRRDDRPHGDRPDRADTARRVKPRDEQAPVKADDQPTGEAPVQTDDAPATDPAAEAKPAAPTAPSLFALQLASPLPPQGATPAAATPAPAEAQPLPVLAGQIPASLAAAMPAEPTGAVAASVAQSAAETAAPAPEGAIALPGLPAEATADTTLPAELKAVKPQPQVAGTQGADSQVKPQDAPLPSQPQADQQPSEQPSTPAPQTASAPQAKPAEAGAPAPAPQPPAGAIAPNAAPAMPTTPGVQRAVPLSRAIPTTGVMVHLMQDKGINHARLNLKPAELGGIEVRLRSTGEGVHALLVADSPEAARMLASAGDDLRRQLEDKNVNLLSLDVSTSDQRQEQAASFSTDGFGDRYRPGHSSTSAGSAHESALLMETPEVADTVLVLPDGVHVDVLA
jgi:flagellar hook-length control protein FliK